MPSPSSVLHFRLLLLYPHRRTMDDARGGRRFVTVAATHTTGRVFRLVNLRSLGTVGTNY